MRRLMVAGNWKMFGSKESVSSLIGELVEGARGIESTDIAVFPPFIYLDMVSQALEGSDIHFGAQTLCEQEQGAFTGEISADMLTDFGCEYVLVGHSERRQLFGESDEQVAEKFVKAQSSGLVPVLCLGETLAEREANETLNVVHRQLDAVLSKSDVTALSNAVLAYEPVWAIGTGVTASPEQAQEVHSAIREHVAGLNADIAAELRILYGGSVNAGNAAQLFAMPDIDGGLVGGASLKPQDFLEICKCISSTAQHAKPNDMGHIDPPRAQPVIVSRVVVIKPCSGKSITPPPPLPSSIQKQNPKLTNLEIHPWHLFRTNPSFQARQPKGKGMPFRDQK